jgi:ketosteroid isomerase-like protein
MKKFTWTSVIVLLSAAAGFAQNPCTRTTPLTDQEHFVRDEIQSRIDESIEAAEAKDVAAKMHYFAPDLTLKLVDGTVLDRKQIEEGMKRDTDWTLSVSDQTTIRIECLELKGKVTVLVTDQHFVRTVPDRKDGSPHELITNVKHRETWVYTEAGWLTKRVEELKQGPTYLDGKLYDE